MDKLTKEQRHRCMSAIKEKNTTPELLVRKFLFSRGYRYRLNHPRLPGKGCKYYVLPKSNTEFWSKKIERNKERDKEVQQELAKMGWHCITIWECWLKPNVRDNTLKSLDYTLNHIYLKDRSIKPYTQEEEETLMVAEPERGYVDSPSDAE